METVIVKPNQTLFDLAAENYGNCEAVAEILVNNPDIRNSKTGLNALGIDYLTDTSFYADAPIETGFRLLIDTDSRLIRNSVIKEIETEVTTFNL